jgi:hypothetical protein
MMVYVLPPSVVPITVILPETRSVTHNPLFDDNGCMLMIGRICSNAIRRSIVISSIRRCTTSSSQAYGLLVRIQFHVWHVDHIERKMKKRASEKGGRERKHGRELSITFIAFVYPCTIASPRFASADKLPIQYTTPEHISTM